MRSYLILFILAFMTTSCKSLSEFTNFSDQNNTSTESLSVDTYTVDFNNETDINRAIETGLTRTQVLLRGGIKYLATGEYDQAKQIFNTALSFDVDNGLLHFFNAFTYHQLFLRGESDNIELAEIGYKVASVKEPALASISTLQLGRLYLDTKRYEEAEINLARAIREGQDSSEVLYDYVRASALNNNWTKSRAAMDQLSQRQWNSPLLIKTKAIYAASFSDPDEAKKLLEDYAAAQVSKEEVNYLKFRINQLQKFTEKGQKVAFNKDAALMVAVVDGESDSSTTADDSEPISSDPSTADSSAPALSAPDPNPGAQAPGTVVIQTPDPTVDQTPEVKSNKGSSADAGEPDSATKSTKKNVALWYRCDTVTKMPERVTTDTSTTYTDTTTASTSTDENTTAVTLPQACPDEDPMTAIVEVTMMSSLDTNSTASGVNILDGLRSILTVSNSTVREFVTGSSPEYTKTNTRSWVLGDASSDTSLAYSLNIANSGVNQSRALSKPTMTIIDRVPSVFFSGSNISLGISPNIANSTPTIVDKTIGTSLAVTPTFIDEDSALVSLRVTASGISSDNAVTTALLQQTRNSMTTSALMNFDDTLILAGLRTDLEKIQSSGVPILQDFPLLQYLFKKTTTGITSVNVIAFITLRRPENSKTGSEPIAYKELNEQISGYIRYEEKDFQPLPTAANKKIAKLIDDLKQVIYF
jgi:tetratricopeptide (TPR) repeat protein